MSFIGAYIKFLWKSTNQYGIHSPFIYKLLTQCFYNHKKKPDYNRIKAFHQKLLQDSRIIKVIDLGAASKVFSLEKRKISAIVKHVGIPRKRAFLLYRIIEYLDVKTVLELGTSLGMATAAMASNRKTRVISLEGCPETAKKAQDNFDAFQFKNIDLRMGEFQDLLNKIPVQSFQEDKKEEKSEISPKFDLIYFDGNPQKKATLTYFEKALSWAHNDSIFIFDDIHWSKETEAAWEDIISHPAVKVSIDSFFWGIIFFRKEQPKQHFTIRL